MIDGFDPPAIFPHPYHKTINSSFSPHQPSCRLTSCTVDEKPVLKTKISVKIPHPLTIVDYDPTTIPHPFLLHILPSFHISPLVD